MKLNKRANLHLKEHYLPHVTEARRRITEDPRLARILDPEIDPVRVLAFLIHFSARGVQMTRPVEDWIRRAGERCLELGFKQLGRTLVSHAKQEAGHDQMMVDDLHVLRERWIALGLPPFDAQRMLEQEPTPAMRHYVDLHEQIIASDHPYRQIAVEDEVEGMSTVLGPALLEACQRALGPEVLRAMSFIGEHAAIDVGHTAMNDAELDRLLEARPELGPILAEAGINALNTYLDFLGDCVDAGDQMVEQLPPRSGSSPVSVTS